MSDEQKAGSTAALKQKLHVEKTPEQLDIEVKAHPAYLELQEKANQHWERLLRLEAEKDNIIRRTAMDVEKAHKYGLDKFARELLPVIDNLERAVAAHLNEESGSGSLLDGIQLTSKMFYSVLEKFGIQQINPEGGLFNPEQHQAVSMEINNTVPAGTILNVLQKGYVLNNRVLRPAMVVVSKTE